MGAPALGYGRCAPANRVGRFGRTKGTSTITGRLQEDGMRARTIVGLVAVAALAGAPLAGCGGKSKSSGTTQPAAVVTTAGPTTTSGGGATTAPASGNALTIQGFAFSPKSLTVSAGTAVTVTNKDGARHTFSSDDGTTFNTPVNGHASATVTVTKPGTYTYHCRIHPSMTGTLIVT
jgi:plastocyanin